MSFGNTAFNQTSPFGQATQQAESAAPQQNTAFGSAPQQNTFGGQPAQAAKPLPEALSAQNARFSGFSSVPEAPSSKPFGKWHGQKLVGEYVAIHVHSVAPFDFGKGNGPEDRAVVDYIILSSNNPEFQGEGSYETNASITNAKVVKQLRALLTNGEEYTIGRIGWGEAGRGTNKPLIIEQITDPTVFEQVRAFAVQETAKYGW